MKKLALSIALLSLALPVPAMAEISLNNKTGVSAGLSTRNLDFSLLDTDSNGSVTSSELNASGKVNASLFGDIDANNDGAVSRTEMNTWNEASVDTRANRSDNRSDRATTNSRNETNVKSNTNADANINAGASAGSRTDGSTGLGIKSTSDIGISNQNRTND